ncbi:hypothetical protein DL96DRAFT_1564788 [Flagelloscypha sp. PMI_526]|nr:hypothetical protein DL96DRAFT_1564788 [Flagelloscypha sp. PMI_526]
MAAWVDESEENKPRERTFRTRSNSVLVLVIANQPGLEVVTFATLATPLAYILVISFSSFFNPEWVEVLMSSASAPATSSMQLGDMESAVVEVVDQQNSHRWPELVFEDSTKEDLLQTPIISPPKFISKKKTNIRRLLTEEQGSLSISDVNVQAVSSLRIHGVCERAEGDGGHRRRGVNAALS